MSAKTKALRGNCSCKQEVHKTTWMRNVKSSRFVENLFAFWKMNTLAKKLCVFALHHENRNARKCLLYLMDYARKKSTATLCVNSSCQQSWHLTSTNVLGSTSRPVEPGMRVMHKLHATKHVGNMNTIVVRHKHSGDKPYQKINTGSKQKSEKVQKNMDLPYCYSLMFLYRS